MAKELFHISLTKNALRFPTDHGNTVCGAHVAFSGIVRGLEGTAPIEGIFYSAYEEMAQPLLEEIASEGRARFPSHGLWIEHRLGFVPAGEPSLHILVTTPHSAEAFQTTQWYLHEIKTRLPVWKEPRFTGSTRRPLEERQ